MPEEGLAPVIDPTPALGSFDPSAVHIHSGRYETAQSTAGSYLLSLDVDRLLAPMRREAGLPMTDRAGTPTEPYPNWESTGLDGHMAAHALSAYVAFAQATDLLEFARRAASLVRGVSYILAFAGGRCMLHIEIMEADCDCDYAVFMNDMPLERTQRCIRKDSSRVIDVYAVPQCDSAARLHETGDAGACARFSLSATATTCGPRVTALRVVTSS